MKVIGKIGPNFLVEMRPEEVVRAAGFMWDSDPGFKALLIAQKITRIQEGFTCDTAGVYLHDSVSRLLYAATEWQKGLKQCQDEIELRFPKL